MTLDLVSLEKWLTDTTPSCPRRGCRFADFHPDPNRGKGMQVGMCKCWDVHNGVLNRFLQLVPQVLINLIARVRELENCPVCHEPAQDVVQHLAVNHAGLMQARMQRAHGADMEFQL